MHHVQQLPVISIIRGKVLIPQNPPQSSVPVESRPTIPLLRCFYLVQRGKNKPCFHHVQIEQCCQREKVQIKSSSIILGLPPKNDG